MMSTNRNNKTESIRLPVRVVDFVKAMGEAHGDMLPDDIRYDMIHKVLSECTFEDYDDDREILDSMIPIYSHTLLQWISSHLSRMTYCDDYQDQYDGSALRLSEILTGGWYTEICEVYNLISGWLDEHCQEDDD